jgi:hypothetical protein
MSRLATFLVNGLGLGNSTRCDAIIQQLIDRGWTVDVITAGNGLWYFNDRPYVRRVYGMEELQYAADNGKLSVIGTIRSLGNLATIARRNSSLISQVINDTGPEVVISDSVYTLKAGQNKRPVRIALNNSDVVHFGYRHFGPPPRTTVAQFYFIEQMDYLYHRFAPDLSISPNIDPSIPALCTNYRRVAPIVRSGYEKPSSLPRENRVVIMLSGSKFGSPVILTRDNYSFDIDIAGRDMPADWEPNDRVRYHGRVENTLPLLRGAALAVINAGFSAVSEICCMGIPAVVIPVENHAEQWLNARAMVSLGLGLMSNEDNLERTMLEAWDRLNEFNGAYERLGPFPSGAQQTATLIEDYVRVR